MTIYEDIKLLQQIFDLYHSSAEEHLAGVDGGPYQILALPMSASSMRLNRDGPWAVKEPYRDLLQVLMLTTWKNATDDDRVRAWTESITDDIGRLAEKDGKLHKSVYVDDANEEQDAFAGYEPENLERMREVSRRYDPEGVFQKLRRGGPTLW